MTDLTATPAAPAMPPVPTTPAAPTTPAVPAVPVWTVHPSPLGDLLISATAGALSGLWVTPHDRVQRSGWHRNDAHPLLVEACRQLDAYFAGECQRFDLPVQASGTPFQQLVWAALREIPYGTTTSYGQLARRIGRSGASRAVGLANGRNPISIVVPCHRVIGANGTLTGYGGGLDRKRLLLGLESATLAGARAGAGGDLTAAARTPEPRRDPAPDPR